MRMNLDMLPSLEALAGLSDELEDSLQQRGVVAERIGQVRLIVEELACNAIHHGQCAARGLPLRLQVWVDREALVLELREHGAAFDPGLQASPALEASVEARPVGGLGLFLVQQMADALDYRREGDTNVVRVTLLRPFSSDMEALS
ncbi:MAG TPA: ATP-binding protein [Stenotrophomonas sp.]|nr:ATP-binding protein [Stenotrophomonas sp.]